MELLTDYSVWGGLLSLTALEIVLGIDNIVFIALLVNHLEPRQRDRARVIGVVLALLLRIVMLFGVVWLISLSDPWVTLGDIPLSPKDVMLIVGGAFLIYKATDSIHDEVTAHKKTACEEFRGSFLKTIMQVAIIDMIFSFDSVITAVGITEHLFVIVIAMTIAMLVMLFFSKMIAEFIAEHSSLKMLALSFVMVIGIFLVAEGLHFGVPKGYIYFGMAFSLTVETLNMLVRKRRVSSSKKI